MTLLDLHVELAESNRLLSRIADALDRAFPIQIPVLDSVPHPLVGIADISHMTPEHSAELAREREENAEAVYFARSQSGAGSDVGASPESSSPTQTRAIQSVSSSWDYEDDLEESWGGHVNHPGS